MRARISSRACRWGQEACMRARISRGGGVAGLADGGGQAGGLTCCGGGAGRQAGLHVCIYI